MTDEEKKPRTGQARENWDPFALLMVDVQHAFLSGEIATAAPAFGQHVAALLGFARQEGIDIVHLRAGFRADQSDWMARYRLAGGIPCVDGTEGAEVLPFAAEQAGETVIRKQTFDGFHRPELAAWLESHNKRHLLIAGLVTSVCVLLTAATAAQRGYLVSIISDCCADTPEAHAHVLRRYPFIGDCVDSRRLLEHRPEWWANLQQLGYLGTDA